MLLLVLTAKYSISPEIRICQDFELELSNPVSSSNSWLSKPCLALDLIAVVSRLLLAIPW
jgi:hypothetical protein